MSEILEIAPARKRDADTSRNKSKPIRAELIGATTCTAAGITARSATPVLALCRQLLAIGLDPDRAVEVYRDAVLALRVRSIGEAAGLTIKDDNRGVPRLVAYRPGPTERGRVACGKAPPMRSNDEGWQDLAGGRRCAVNRPDPREAFLARAAARDRLFCEHEMSLDEAFDGLVPAFLDIIGRCTCEREIIERLLSPLPRRRAA